MLGPTVGAWLFREPSVGDYILPLSAGVLLSCYQSVLSGALNGDWEAGHRRPQRHPVRRGAAGVYLLPHGYPGSGAGGLCGRLCGERRAGGVSQLGAQVRRATGLRLQLYQWCTAPALAALLTALTVNLLFQVLLGAGLDGRAAAVACILFGLTLYLAALSAQGVRLRPLFSLGTSAKKGSGISS